MIRPNACCLLQAPRPIIKGKPVRDYPSLKSFQPPPNYVIELDYSVAGSFVGKDGYRLKELQVRLLAIQRPFEC
jgi:hypothetical protein